jgi:hypothetical protein
MTEGVAAVVENLSGAKALFRRRFIAALEVLRHPKSLSHPESLLLPRSFLHTKSDVRVIRTMQ